MRASLVDVTPNTLFTTRTIRSNVPRSPPRYRNRSRAPANADVLSIRTKRRAIEALRMCDLPVAKWGMVTLGTRVYMSASGIGGMKSVARWRLIRST